MYIPYNCPKSGKPGKPTCMIPVVTVKKSKKKYKFFGKITTYYELVASKKTEATTYKIEPFKYDKSTTYCYLYDCQTTGKCR